MKKEIDLVHGSIVKGLSLLAIPIMATYVVQMAYNMIDMIWIGKIGANAVSSVGAAGNFMYLISAFVYIPKYGAQSLVGQKLGANQKDEAKKYVRSAFQLAIIVSFLSALITVLFYKNMIAFFHFKNNDVIIDAEKYLFITCVFLIFTYVNQTFTAIYTASAKSNIPFIMNGIGVILNIVLDPIFIFIFHLGVSGAAIATVLSQCIVTIIFIIYKSKNDIFNNIHVLKIEVNKWIEIIKIGFPASLQDITFMVVNICISRIISSYGDEIIAVQKIGWQVENITYMTAQGFSASINSFSAQNYGAHNYHRVKQGYLIGNVIIGIWGIFTSILLIVFGKQCFLIFIKDYDLLPYGIDYLRIVGYSQFFMCLEYAGDGAFYGLGKSLPPSIVSIVFTTLRVPFAFVLSAILGVNGIWIAISLSSVCKGIIIVLCYSMYSHKYLKEDSI